MNINDMSIKINMFKIKKSSRYTALFHSFANLIIVWLSSRQLDSHISFCIQSWEILLFWLKDIKNKMLHIDMNAVEE